MLGLGCGLSLSVGTGGGGGAEPPFFVWPDASNTGHRTALTPYEGPSTITTPGTLIEGKSISGGSLTIAASNVTIRDCSISNFGLWGIVQDGEIENTVIEYCTIDAAGALNTSGLGVGGGASSVIQYCDISGVTLAIQLFGTCHVHHNYIHDLSSVSSDPDDRHFDGVTVFGGGAGTVIENNTIIMPNPDGGTAAVFIATRFGAIDDVEVSHNKFEGLPSYAAYIENTGAGVTNISVLDNEVQRGSSGWFGVVGTTITASGNFDPYLSVSPGGQSPIVIEHPGQEPFERAFTPSATMNTNDTNANISLRHVLVLDEAVPGDFRVAIEIGGVGVITNLSKASVGVSAGSGDTVGTPVELRFNSQDFPTVAEAGQGFVALSDPVNLGALADGSSIVIILDFPSGDNGQRFGSGNTNITTYFKTGPTYDQATPGGLTHSSGNNFGVFGIYQ
jgi:hypothetical protein